MRLFAVWHIKHILKPLFTAPIKRLTYFWVQVALLWDPVRPVRSEDYWFRSSGLCKPVTDCQLFPVCRDQVDHSQTCRAAFRSVPALTGSAVGLLEVCLRSWSSLGLISLTGRLQRDTGWCLTGAVAALCRLNSAPSPAQTEHVSWSSSS